MKILQELMHAETDGPKVGVRLDPGNPSEAERDPSSSSCSEFWHGCHLPISTPMRFVRSAKRNEDSLQPKSRWIIPGHLDPLIRKYRTDAPRTPWVAVQIAVTIAVRLNMSGETFHVSSAFQTGMLMDR